MLSGLVFALLALAADQSEAPGGVSTRVVAPPVAEATAQAYSWRPVAIGGGGFITGYSADAKGSDPDRQNRRLRRLSLASRGEPLASAGHDGEHAARQITSR
jgi:hypothetical protein